MKDGYILLPQPIEAEAMAVLDEAKVRIVTAADPKPETVLPLMADARAIVLRTGITITGELLAGADSLLTISRTGAGVDNVDLDAATKKGVLVTSSLGVNTSSVMEHCLALIMSLFKRLPLMDSEVRKNNFAIRYKNIPSDLHGKTLGLVGYGRIGSLLADACRSIFGMDVLAFDAYLSDAVREQHQDRVAFVSLDDVCRRADVISVHIPLTAETRHMFNSDFFRNMKKTAFFVNTSRGGVVSEADLVAALRNGDIAGAGLDVFENEPIQPDSALLSLDNAILTPHTAALTSECVVRMAVSGARRVVEVLDGRTPENIANPAVLAHPRWKTTAGST